MAYHEIDTQAKPGANPGAGSADFYSDINDDNKFKQLDEKGVVSSFVASFDKNILNNGGFSINQRLPAALTNIPGASTTARVLTADRWGFTVGNVTTPQFQQVDARTAPITGLKASYYGKYKQLTNAAKICISQVISSVEVMPLRNRYVRFQIKARWTAGANRTMRLGLMQLTNAGAIDTMPAGFIGAFNGVGVDPTLGANLSYIAPYDHKGDGNTDNATISGSAASFTLTNTFQRFSALFLVPSDCKNLVVAVWSNDTFAVNDDIDITECGLYDGQEIMDWIPLPNTVELLRCQRFYCKTFPQGTAPAQNAGTNGSLKGIVGKAAATALACQGDWRFPVVMFKTPAITLYSPGAASAQARRISGAAAADQTVSASANVCDDSATITATGDAAGVVGDLWAVHIAADAEL